MLYPEKDSIQYTKNSPSLNKLFTRGDSTKHLQILIRTTNSNNVYKKINDNGDDENIVTKKPVTKYEKL